MKLPAECWIAARPDSRVADLPLGNQEIVTAAYWPGAAEALSAVVRGDTEVIVQIERCARKGETRH